MNIASRGYNLLWRTRIVGGFLFYSLFPLIDAMAANDALSLARSRIKVPDVTLVDQSGNSVRLVSDVIGKRTAVINFIFTSCTSICPAISSVMQRVQRSLDTRLSKDVVLISISVDPTNDTPDRLAAYSKQFGRRDGWYWLTGRPAEIRAALKSFSSSVASPEDHAPLVLIGKASEVDWIRFVGFPDPKDLLSAVDEIGQ